ncbi:MAG TPA: cytochrome c maturation protein CcmE [Bryobacteraceae bacterium]|jgi:cytochrome c-type biogenesis protein CcmE|nr:cytochrome c maturation protein CcmE [Bryobacteraceae bacterium]
MNKYGKFAILMAIIVGSLGFLAYSGIQGSTTYYKTITELHQMGNAAQIRHVRVGGDVQSNSIVHNAGVVTFNLTQVNPDGAKQILRVAYEGRDPLPDTFRDGAQALADGHLGTDGVFHASEIQAKCASKYAPKPGMAPDQLQPGAKPAQTNSMRSSL